LLTRLLFVGAGALRTGNLKVPHVSVTSIGASPYPTAQPWSGPPGNWQADRPSDQNANNAAGNPSGGVNNATSSGAGTTTGPSGIGKNGASGIGAGGGTGSTDANRSNTSGADDDRTANDNNLPPVQAATAPGTGQKVDIIV
jgi:hypothetical protein